MSFSGVNWAAVAELLASLLDIVLDPNYALHIPQGTTLNVGQGVTISATSDGFAVINAGTINNNGSIIGVSGGDGGLSNIGTINNGQGGYLQFGATNVNLGIINDGYINNIGYLQGYSDLYGIINEGTINNIGELEGDGGSTWLGDTATTGQGIYNYGGHINNFGVVTGDSSWGDIGQPPQLVYPYGINNGGALNDYCGNLQDLGWISPDYHPLIYSSYGGTPPNPISCDPVQFQVYGITDGALASSVQITVSWGPFVLPWSDRSVGGYNMLIFDVPATEPLTYSFPGEVGLYTCQSGCSGTVTNGGPVVVVYSVVNPAPPAGVPQFPLGAALLFALLVPALLVLRKRVVSFSSLH
jgi:hypothetical protein